MIDEKALQAAIPVGSNMANADLVRAIIEAYEAARSAEAVVMSDHCALHGCVHAEHGCPAWAAGTNPFAQPSLEPPNV